MYLPRRIDASAFECEGDASLAVPLPGWHTPVVRFWAVSSVALEPVWLAPVLAKHCLSASLAEPLGGSRCEPIQCCTRYLLRRHCGLRHAKPCRGHSTSLRDPCKHRQNKYICLTLFTLVWKHVDVGSVTQCSVRARRTHSTPQPLVRRKLSDLLQRSPWGNPRTPRLSASKLVKCKVPLKVQHIIISLTDVCVHVCMCTCVHVYMCI